MFNVSQHHVTAQLNPSLSYPHLTCGSSTPNTRQILFLSISNFSLSFFITFPSHLQSPSTISYTNSIKRLTNSTIFIAKTMHYFSTLSLLLIVFNHDLSKVTIGNLTLINMIYPYIPHLDYISSYILLIPHLRYRLYINTNLIL